MKLPFVLPFWWFALLFGMRPYPTECMDYTPPTVIPDHLKDKIDKEHSGTPDEMPHKHKRHSHQEIIASVTDEAGKEVRIDIKQDGTLSGSTDDSSKSGHSTKLLAISNTVTGLVTAVIGAGVTLAVKYGDCKKDC